MTGREIRLGRRHVLAAAGTGLVLAGCGERPAGQQESSSPPPTERFVFADASAPGTLDPSVDLSMEAARISSQILEPLIQADRNTGEPVPGLAESWEVAGDRRSVTFHLRRDVRFHDGSPMDAHAVRANFEKWKRQAGEDLALTGRTPFAAAFRYMDPSRATATSYADLEVVDEHTALLTLRHPYTPVLRALTQPAFGIAAPSSIERGSEGTHPVGTGPFRFESVSGDSVHLGVNPDYWGRLGHIGSLEFRTLPDSAVRYAAFLTGQVDAYDMVGMDAFAPLARNGTQVLYRDPYSVSFVAINQGVSVLRDPSVRQAVAAAIDRGAVQRDFYPNGTAVAEQLIPAKFGVNSDEARVPGYNPQRAKDLLKDSRYDGEPLRFLYPRETSRLYLQQPEQVYASISANLVRAGFTIRPQAVDWTDAYTKQAADPDAGHAFALLGWSGQFRDPDNFMGTLLGAHNALLGHHGQGLVTAVNRAAATPDGESRARAYRTLNERVARLLPAIPLTHPVSAVAVNHRVATYPLTSTGFDRFNELRFS